MGISLQEEVREKIHQIKPTLSPKVKQMAEEAVVKIKQGNLPKDALGFTPAMMETIYNYGHNQFQAGKYQEALRVFTFLRSLDVANYRYSFAIAACHQYLKEYTEAAANYIICGHLDKLNPVPSFHLYECFIQLNQPLSALQAISETMALADLHPHYQTLKEKATLEYQAFRKQIDPYLKEKFNKEGEKQ